MGTSTHLQIRGSVCEAPLLVTAEPTPVEQLRALDNNKGGGCAWGE